MPTIEVDDEVFRALELRVRGFGDSPNKVLRREFELPDASGEPEIPRTEPIERHPVRRIRRKAQKASLSTLARQGTLCEGQSLYLHDYRGMRTDGEAKIKGDGLEYEGRLYSMSALTRQLMQEQGFGSEQCRGPHHWYTDQGQSIRELWESHLQRARSQGGMQALIDMQRKIDGAPV